MATPRQTRNKLFALAEQRIKLLYGDAYTRALKIAEVRKALDAAENVNFNFKAFPRAEKELNTILKGLSIDVEKMAKNALLSAYNTGLKAATANILAVTASTVAKDLTEQATADNRLSQALGTAIANAKRGGVTLSERIWASVQTSRKELEIIIQNNIIEGKGADVASREVRQYLNDPKKLFRRVKDKETGEYHLSKAAQQYHPGQGKYRSSYMNARRLVVTEMNMATQASECAAYADNPLIAGYEIRLSNNHTVKDPRHPGKVLDLHDICDELQGKYPKWFKFSGFHPHCRCSMIPILISPDERRKLAQARAEGKTYQPKGVITDVPDNFKTWVAENQDRIQNAATLPYFLQDNGELTKDGYVINLHTEPEPTPTAEPTNTEPQKSHALQVAEQRHAARTDAEKQQIVAEWEKERKLMEICPVDFTPKEQYTFINNIKELAKNTGVETGLPMSFEKADNGAANPNFASGGGYHVNCQTCTVALEARMRGINAEAKPNINGSAHKTVPWEERFLNIDGSKVKYTWSWQNNVRKTFDSKMKFIENTTTEVGRYEIYCAWSRRGAHVYNVFREKDGSLTFYDPQSNEKDKLSLGQRLNRMKYNQIAILRIDNKIINPLCGQILTHK